ncbi:hypothetical protein HAX54_046115, partial [Datura stramonium]|nr:hypothetical protein [Datura stramonium]
MTCACIKVFVDTCGRRLRPENVGVLHYQRAGDGARSRAQAQRRDLLPRKERRIALLRDGSEPSTPASHSYIYI